MKRTFLHLLAFTLAMALSVPMLGCQKKQRGAETGQTSSQSTGGATGMSGTTTGTAETTGTAGMTQPGGGGR